ncbi:DUF3899 domain-containing protein [Staphylococcus simiae]|uniref:DUF3899 domain-containing protein n=1 Tax=Staphylococcus simiae TaxID=308354 RepID=UPI001A96AB3D|nr:DUF3899 domain-containing protein [Staphylococcus simiae]MBO1199341.1 DUF3899 domain-containing protein [Staphylococcus simiae]MBO1201668.1 DUF3899 domain-containing protein [Staphylococcus simiae]MBO1203788.1 DUF3899 domain-containing protein [Staphylococcus simiae]MBO1211944.1 DUF3899 domain-containing protein [Staphylococcus simiae]MBO1230049.1 DUF3899 domain-containing protein [Staphylococcus simiae]
MFKNLIFILFTPIISVIIWLFGQHELISFINILFYVSLLMFIVSFVILIVQEGIFDATSYGFRRLKYQMSSTKKKKALADDDFFNPRHIKKEHYIVSSWIYALIIINFSYFVISILVSVVLSK